MHLGCCSIFGKRKNTLACAARVHGKPFSNPLVIKLLYIHIFDHLFIVSFSKYHNIKRCRIILIFLPSFNRKYKKITRYNEFFDTLTSKV